MTTEALLQRANIESVSTCSQSVSASTLWTVQSETGNSSDQTITAHRSENQATNENPAKNTNPPWITRRQLIIILIINFSVLSEASCYSILAPFFPQMAERKNLTPTQYGFVFGIFHLVLLVSSPIIPKLVSFINAKFLVNSGIFFAGGCSILFGILDRSPPGTTFLVLSLVVRILEAFGTAAMFIISYTIVGSEFTKHRATAL
ncbi:MFS-type transporter SLC18B1-like, partial [Limulus polyphemus]|uniref:MFS-type transporter SLC18B1-like n=1 Tax=Limulus polyphemus TaxID=6850 RepID=A0ABM1RXQ7_LIMPO